MNLTELIELGDLDELLREIDRVCERRHWSELVELRDRCRLAIERGKQLWPAAAHADYRLALEAPGEWAGPVLVDGAGRFSLGPLPEVAASTHTWEELAPWVKPGPAASVAAFECVVRGQDLTDDDRIDPSVFDIPLRLQPWEPAYPVAEYRADKAYFPAPVPPTMADARLPRPGRRISDPGARALADLASVWTSESNGHADAIAVRGTALSALTALGAKPARVAPITAPEALARMAWTAASGGAHGRRRGMAAGRFNAWWTLAAIAGLLNDWPIPPDELGEAAQELRWYWWDTGTQPIGWSLQLAVEDPAEGLAWAVIASDSA